MRRRRFVAATSFAAVLILAGLPEAALALTGQITHLSGAVIARRVDGQSRILSIRSEVQEGDVVITADNTYVRIKWADGGEVVLRPNTQLKVDAYSYDELAPQRDNIGLSLLKGGLRSITGLLARRNPANFRLATPTATVGIRGTHFGVLYCSEEKGKNDCEGIQTVSGATPAVGVHVDVSDGVIFVSTPAGSLEVKVGEFAYVASLTVLPVLVPANLGTRVDLPPQMTNLLIQGGTVGKGSELECTIK